MQARPALLQLSRFALLRPRAHGFLKTNLTNQSRGRAQLRNMSGVLGLDEIPTLSSLYKDGSLAKPSTSTAQSDKAKSYNSKISLIQYDITKLAVGAVVNAANKQLAGGAGVDGAIHRAAGHSALQEACQKLGGCDTGSAKITDAFKLPCEKIIHSVGPDCRRVQSPEERTSLLQGCYRTSLELAVENDLKSVAFPALSTGVYAYPSNEAAQAAAEEVKKFLDSGKGDKLDRIIFCNFTDKDQDAYVEWLPKFFPPSEENIGKDDEGDSRI